MLYALFSADDLLLPVHHGLAVSYLRIPTREAEPEEDDERRIASILLLLPSLYVYM